MAILILVCLAAGFPPKDIAAWHQWEAILCQLKWINHISVFAGEALGHLLECRVYKWYTKGGGGGMQLGSLNKED